MLRGVPGGYSGEENKRFEEESNVLRKKLLIIGS
jgi:hypothetical protein